MEGVKLKSWHHPATLYPPCQMTACCCGADDNTSHYYYEVDGFNQNATTMTLQIHGSVITFCHCVARENSQVTSVKTSRYPVIYTQIPRGTTRYHEVPRYFNGIELAAGRGSNAACQSRVRGKLPVSAFPGGASTAPPSNCTVVLVELEVECTPESKML